MKLLLRKDAPEQLPADFEAARARSHQYSDAGTRGGVELEINTAVVLTNSLVVSLYK
jgi:hypothetical protein